MMISMSPDPPVLDYRGREPRQSSRKLTDPVLEFFAFLMAAVFGFALFAIFGLGTLYRLKSSGAMRIFGWSFVILGIVLLIYGVITHSHRRFFLAGLLVGCGLAMTANGCILFMASYALA
jgi:hypothetical protein